uniref:Putative LOC101484488 [Maylandia zebra] n=1 Tax=Lepeophtheirus salmonis TaxID=72036 RepID=A0A0K2VB51_LEPSM
MEELKNKKSTSIVGVMKSVFARHGIPETFVSHIGPFVMSREFSDFGKEWGFNHTFSSPKPPHHNSLAERGVQTVNKFLKKKIEM